MVGEVNKIIFNALVSGRGIFLPQVGSLFIERQAARKIADNKYYSPRNVVVFSSKEMAVSLVQEIVNVASCTEQQALDIYTRWLDKTRQDNHLIIGGVGELVDKSFRMEEEFAKAINPKGVRTIVVRRRSHWWVFVLALICLLVAGGVFFYANMLSSTESDDVVVVKRDSSREVDKQQIVDDSLQVGAVDASGDALSSQMEVKDAEQTTSLDESSTHSAQQSVVEGQSVVQFAYYVVCGVYADENNVPKAISQLKANMPTAQFVILPYKGKFMITAFGSDSHDDCQSFVNRYQAKQRGLWIYKAQ